VTTTLSRTTSAPARRTTSATAVGLAPAGVFLLGRGGFDRLDPVGMVLAGPQVGSLAVGGRRVRVLIG